MIVYVIIVGGGEEERDEGRAVCSYLACSFSYKCVYWAKIWQLYCSRPFLRSTRPFMAVQNLGYLPPAGCLPHLKLLHAITWQDLGLGSRVFQGSLNIF